MASHRLRAAQRPLVLYLAAVVGPTLAVLALGAVTARRQVAALDALRLTTERLQESSVAIEFERSSAARAAAALADPSLDELADAASGTDAVLLDRAQQHALALSTRYPFAQFAFVLVDGDVRYPRIHAPWPQDVVGELAAESPVVRRAYEIAQRSESLRAYAAAGAEYATLERLARSKSLQAFALASRAAAAAHAGDRIEAIVAYRRLHDDFADAYSPAGRPYALLAAVELAHLRETADPRLIRTRQDLAAGRWSITSDQAGYFLGQLAGAPVLNVRTPFLAAATEARRLSAVSFAATDGTADHVLFAALGDERDFLQLAYRGNGANRIVGVALSLPWLREHVLPEVARGVVADRGAELVRLAAGHPSFHTMLPGWSVRLLPATNQRTSWLRADFIAFAAIAVVVIGVLVMGVLVLMRDIQRETKLNQLRADLVGGVSHELKTPLSVIRVYAETLDEVPDVAATDRRRFAKAIVQETERLRRLIDGVIDFSRIQQGQRAYALVPGSIAPLVARTAERFGEYLAVHDFALRTSIDMDVPPVEFDEIAVEQAVLNLLDNAFKYSGESRELAVSVCAEGQRVFVRVADHGVGIAPSDHHRVFERFQRGDHPDRGGYGLGLYLVRHIMAAHGGRVQLVSAPDEGSTFTLEFPTASEAIRQRVVRQAAVSHETSEVAYVEGAARRG